LIAPAGISTTVEPSSFTLAPGESQNIKVKFETMSTAVLNSYSFGSLTWVGNRGHLVRSPIAIRPVALAVPASVSSDGSVISYNVTFGYTGPFSVAARGLVPAITSPGTVMQDPDQTFDLNDPAGTVAIPVTIPVGTTYARFALFDEDVTPDSDIDLYVYQGTNLVGSSGGGTAAEEVNIPFAAPTASPINLVVYVHGWGLPAGSSPFVLNSFYVGASAAGNMSVSAPASATLGASGTVNVSFSGLVPATRYLGSLVYSGASGMPDPTIVSVKTP
jgi:hypothetical protein